MLRELGFILHVDHPHKTVLNYLSNAILDAEDLMQEAWNLTNDRYRPFMLWACWQSGCAGPDALAAGPACGPRSASRCGARPSPVALYSWLLAACRCAPGDLPSCAALSCPLESPCLHVSAISSLSTQSAATLLLQLSPAPR